VGFEGVALWFGPGSAALCSFELPHEHGAQSDECLAKQNTHLVGGAGGQVLDERSGVLEGDRVGVGGCLALRVHLCDAVVRGREDAEGRE